MKISKLHENIGVSVEEIDLKNINHKDVERIKILWMENLIILFPNQNISDEDHIIFGKKTEFQGSEWKITEINENSLKLTETIGN